jgi:hypothetical protein
MTDPPIVHTTFSETDIQAFAPELKIGLLATVNPAGLPHLTLISSLSACSPTQVTWGQFTEGFSKAHVRQNPKTGFLIMSLQKDLWRGKATFTHTAQGGPEFDRYNNQPMFRYNAYFGIHTVYYMDLVAHTGCQPLPLNAVVRAAVLTLLARTIGGPRRGAPVLNGWTRGLFNKLGNLKFIAYVGSDGYPVIVPVVQAQASDRERVIFALSAYGDELRGIPPGATVAVFGMALSMEDVLLRGEYRGVRRIAGVPCGMVAVNWVYNPMPPVPGQIYPERPLQAAYWHQPII